MGNNIPLNQEVNTSGQGKNALIPREVKRFNWGAFFFTWIWGLVNKSYLTLISLALWAISFVVPFIFGFGAGLSGNETAYAVGTGFGFIFGIISSLIGLGLRIWFGIKGNDWAWQNKHWQSTEHFNDVQKIWATVGTVLFIVYIGLILLGFLGAITALVLPSVIGK